MKQIDSDEEYFRALAQPVRVLLVEDESMVQKVFRVLTSEYNVALAMCSDGETALQMFEPGKFDLVILDIRLPGINGAEVFRRIRELDRKVFVAVLSGFLDREMREKLSGLSPITFIEKPKDFNPDFIREFFHQVDIPKLSAEA